MGKSWIAVLLAALTAFPFFLPQKAIIPCCYTKVVI